MQSPNDSPRGRLLENYVCARIVDMTGIDIGLFDYDRHNAIYFFLLNGNEDIYLRYGGRDKVAGDTYLHLDSFTRALESGLELHKAHQAGEWTPPEKPAPRYPKDVPMLRENTIERGRCVECHLIADFTLQQKELDGTLDTRRDLFPAPDIKKLGIELDVPTGLGVKTVTGPAKAAGMAPGDRIIALEGAAVYTFGDFQYRYADVDRDAESLSITVARGDATEGLTIGLPKQWWRTDTFYRFWTVEPQLYFFARPLSAEEKRALDLPVNGFASEVDEVDPGAKPLRLHTLQVGDIITAVNGVSEDPICDNAEFYIILNTPAGGDYTMTVLRDGERLEMTARSYRQYFRKEEPRSVEVRR